MTNNSMNHLLKQLGKVLPPTFKKSKRNLDLESNDKNNMNRLLKQLGKVLPLTNNKSKERLNQEISLIHNVLCEWLGVQIYYPNQGVKLIQQHRWYSRIGLTCGR